MNTKQKTMPNGLGQGGQLNYFAYWIDSEFGRVSTAPSCTTFHSPQLGVQVMGSNLQGAERGCHFLYASINAVLLFSDSFVFFFFFA